MSVEQTAPPEPKTVGIPGMTSPIESIRAIQEDRIAKQATGGPEVKREICRISLVGKNVQVDSRVPAEALLQALQAAYMAVRQEIHPDPRIAVPERKILVP